MNAYKIVALVVLGCGCLAVVGDVGKPRGPRTPEDAVWTLIISGLVAAMVVLA